MFEYDPSKSAANLSKHGIGFEEAQSLFSDFNLLTIAARSEGEPRYLAIGTLNERIWSCIFTRRGPNIRIISVRRARPEEVKLYEGE